MNACPVCGSTTSEILFEKNGFPVNACKECATAFVTKTPSANELKNYYSLDYFEGNPNKFGYINYAQEEPFQAASFQRKAQYLTKIMKGGRILDVGCATSSFLKQLGNTWEKHGVEVSLDLLKTYSPPKDVKVWSGDFLDYPEDGQVFDAITLWDVLDHVADPKSTILKAHRLLRPGGVIGILTGDRSSLFARILGKRWHIYIPPTHLTFFTRTSLLRMLESCNFKPSHWEYEGRSVPLSLCFFRLNYIVNLSLIRKLYEWSLGTMLRNVKIYINLHDVVTIYATKA